MGVPACSVTMKSFIVATLLGYCLAAPTTHVASGEPAGPLTIAFGDAVHTPKGLRSYSLEGFSEDVDQDGFVDPIGQAVVVAPAPVTYTVPQVYTHPVAVAPAPVKEGVLPASPRPPPSRPPRTRACPVRLRPCGREGAVPALSVPRTRPHWSGPRRWSSLPERSGPSCCGSSCCCSCCCCSCGGCRGRSGRCLKC